jgi:hypothetical protein
VRVTDGKRTHLLDVLDVEGTQPNPNPQPASPNPHP